jgi:LAO/AO transport system kinase
VSTLEELASRVLQGDHGAIARLLTHVERRTPGVNAIVADLHRTTGNAHVVGVTGPPGSGKSTLVSALAAKVRRQGRTVGILAVDPSSVFSGGAILGDRIRMSDLSGDRGVYIRSIATRGALGGLSRAALDAITVLDAAGLDVIVLETVGVGQAEVDVLSAAQSVIVVSVPGAGDDVQAIKAGLLEIADIHVVNKADRDGARKTVAELREVLRLSKRVAGQWNVPILLTTATKGEGLVELIEQLDAHHVWMAGHGELEARARRTSATRIRWQAEEIVLDRLRSGAPAFEHAVSEVAARRVDPLAAARELIDQL